MRIIGLTCDHRSDLHSSQFGHGKGKSNSMHAYIQQEKALLKCSTNNQSILYSSSSKTPLELMSWPFHSKHKKLMISVPLYHTKNMDCSWLDGVTLRCYPVCASDVNWLWWGSVTKEVLNKKKSCPCKVKTTQEFVPCSQCKKSPI